MPTRGHRQPRSPPPNELPAEIVNQILMTLIQRMRWPARPCRQTARARGRGSSPICLRTFPGAPTWKVLAPQAQRRLGQHCYSEGDRISSSARWNLADLVSGPLRVLVESRREQVMAIAARNHASRVRLFGSAARGDDSAASDIDLLVDFDQDSSLFDLMHMARELQALFGRAVDVVSAGGLKGRDRAILAESVDL